MAEEEKRRPPLRVPYGHHISNNCSSTLSLCRQLLEPGQSTYHHFTRTAPPPYHSGPFTRMIYTCTWCIYRNL